MSKEFITNETNLGIRTHWLGRATKAGTIYVPQDYRIVSVGSVAKTLPEVMTFYNETGITPGSILMVDCEPSMVAANRQLLSKGELLKQTVQKNRLTRSMAPALQHIQKIDPVSEGRFQITMQHGHRFPVEVVLADLTQDHVGQTDVIDWSNAWRWFNLGNIPDRRLGQARVHFVSDFPVGDLVREIGARERSPQLRQHAEAIMQEAQEADPRVPQTVKDSPLLAAFATTDFETLAAISQRHRLAVEGR